MKSIIVAIVSLTTLTGCAFAQDAVFTTFKYEGHDARFEKACDTASEYLNPILAGFYPDPSICRKGDTYYLVNSSFSFFPGVPIFESRDLVNWTQIGHVLDRQSQLPLEGQWVSGGIYAPAISYNPSNDTFYMVTTNVGAGGNFFVKTKDPHKGWSDPIYLPEVNGIDPSFLFDDDGKAYLVHNSEVMGTASYDGERAIRLFEFSVENDCTVGEPLEIVRGGTHVEKNPIWIEGPHLYHIGNYYYLMCAEGGTGDRHSEVIFRAPRPQGPWEECPRNPILTQRTGLDPARADIVTSTGHADIIQAPDGSWWGVFLGCRPYEGDLYNTGRETFLLPVSWEDGWPVILEAGKAVPTVVKKEGLAHQDGLLTGNFSYTDKLTEPGFRWVYLRTPMEDKVKFTRHGLSLTPHSAVFCRQQHTSFTAETRLEYRAEQEGGLAGMVLFQNEQYNLVFGKTLLGGKPAVVLERTEGAKALIGSHALKHNDKPLRLKVEGDGRYYSFYYAEGDAGRWHLLSENVDCSNLSTNRAGGFIGTMIGLCATGGE